jgi:hypothetical protein
MSNTTEYIIKKRNDTPKKYKIVIIVEADDGISLPEEICQRVLADDIETEDEARNEVDLILADYIIE